MSNTQILIQMSTNKQDWRKITGSTQLSIINRLPTQSDIFRFFEFPSFLAPNIVKV